MSFQEFVELGKTLGFEGKDLNGFAETKSNGAREERVLEREHARELKELELRIAEENATRHSVSSSSVQEFYRKRPDLPAFDEKCDDIDSYLKRFERFMTSLEIPKTQWAVLLSSVLTGKALSVYSRLPDEHVKDYDRLKSSLLRKYDLNGEGFRRKFRYSRPEGGETYLQFVERMKGFLTRWVELTNTTKSYEGLCGLMLKEQLFNGFNRDLGVFVKERQPKSLEDVAKLADQYIEAHGKNWGKKVDKRPAAVNAKSSQAERNDQSKDWAKSKRCYTCNEYGHVSRDCRAQRNNPPRGRGNFERAAGCENPNAQDKKNSKKRDESAGACQAHRGHEPMGAQNLPVISAVCVNENMPVMEGLLEGHRTMVLRDTGCSTVVVRRKFVDESKFTGENRRCVLLDGTIRDVPVARVLLDSPFYVGEVEALVMNSPIYDVILGNIEGVRGSIDPNPKWQPSSRLQAEESLSESISGAVQTRGQKAKGERPLSPLKTSGKFF
ncbi:hypothetical protein BSL78_15966 [Apostichopus japonicus]|uniref:CCHC-type domain-containing protein n=1 Tax=Stichopus japonicus TaxID=307972 RepID=A0A2G8KGN5_STIJA|nr:hypothetical protein BSL78_15966 [Apostichopus japonicus]